MSTLRDTGRAASSMAGQVLRGATKVVTARPADKPLHPHGAVLPGTLRRYGAPGPGSSGVAWLDEPGEHEVIVRQSRAIGLPAPAPDIFGLAIRVTLEDSGHGQLGQGDLLFATTGLGRVTRYTLTPALSPYGRPLTTLLPYRTAAGPLLLSAVWEGETEVALAWSVGSGRWQHFADLHLHGDPVDDPDAGISFDPVLNQLPGFQQYDWVRRLREPSYFTARRSRG